MSKRKSKSTAKNPAARAQAAPLPRTDQDRLPAWAAAIVLALAIGIVYGPHLNVPFIFDDDTAIVINKSIVSLWPLIGTDAQPGPLNPPPGLPTTARPLVNLSFAINYYFGELNPFGYHAANALIHLCSAMLLWAIVRHTLRLPYFARSSFKTDRGLSRFAESSEQKGTVPLSESGFETASNQFDRSAEWLALVVSMLWALHPLQTEAVIYATQRTELMMACFYLATLYCSLRYWQASRAGFRATWLALATLACAAGMASKEVMVSAPLIVLLFDRTFFAGSLARALRGSWRLYLCLVSTWLILLALGISAPHSHSAGFRLGVSAVDWWMTQCKVLLMYLKLFVWPSPLLIHYQMPLVTTLADAWKYVVPVMLLGLATLELLRRNYAVGFLGTCVFAILAPTSLIPIISEPAAERRMYLPLAALVPPLVVAGYRILRRVASMQRTASTNINPRYGLIATAFVSLGVTAAFGLGSTRRLASYHDGMQLFQQVLELQPENHLAHENLGHLLDKAGNIAGAIAEYRESVRLNPDAPQAQYTLGGLLHQTGAHDEAAKHFAAAARLVPKNAVMRNNLGYVLYIAGRNDEAMAVFRETLKLDPSNWAAHKNLGTALQKAGRHQEAIESYERAIKLNPATLDVYDDLAKAYARQNQRDQARATLRQALQIAQAAGDIENTNKFNARLIETR